MASLCDVASSRVRGGVRSSADTFWTGRKGPAFERIELLIQRAPFRNRVYLISAYIWLTQKLPSPVV